MSKKKDIVKLSEQWAAKSAAIRAEPITPENLGELSAYERAEAIVNSRKQVGYMRRMLLRAQEFAIAYRNSIRPQTESETLQARLSEYRAKCNAYTQIMKDWDSA